MPPRQRSRSCFGTWPDAALSFPRTHELIDNWCGVVGGFRIHRGELRRLHVWCGRLGERCKQGGSLMTPAWMLDAGSLRFTLDKLRDSMTRSSGAAALDLAAVMLHDKAAILSSV